MSNTVKQKSRHLAGEALHKLPPDAREKAGQAAGAVQRNPASVALAASGVIVAVWLIVRLLTHRETPR